MTPEEYSLINKARQGDTKAFEELVYKYDKTVLSIAYSYRNSGDDAKDIYQEVFLRVFRSLKDFEGKSEFSTWLYRITVNVCLTYNSRKKRNSYIPLHQAYKEENENSTTMADIIPDNTTADQLVLEDELAAGMQRVIDDLSGKQKMAVTLKYYEDKKIREIAEIMNCNEGTIKRYLFDAVRKMRRRLKNY